MTGILSSEVSRLGESVLLRWCVGRRFVSEAQFKAVVRVKQELLAGFKPADLEVGYRLFAQRFRELADRAAGT